MVEGARLESVYVRSAIRGFESPLTAIQITILYKYPDHFLNHRFRYFMDIKKHALSVLLLFIRVFS